VNRLAQRLEILKVAFQVGERHAHCVAGNLMKQRLGTRSLPLRCMHSATPSLAHMPVSTEPPSESSIAERTRGSG
jgi:hypothetical protein